MPMNTTLEIRPGPPATRPLASAWAPLNICVMISPVDRFLVRPAWPVAQNGHAMPPPVLRRHQLGDSGRVAHQPPRDQRPARPPPQGLTGQALIAGQLSG